MADFEVILRGSIQRHQSGVVDAATAIGMPMERSSADVTKLVASGTHGGFAGFLVRPVVAGGPALIDSLLPGRLELPYTAGREASVESAEVIEVQGNSRIANGADTGAITGGTAAGTLLGISAGKFRIKQAADHAHAQLEAQLTAEADGEAGLRLRIRMIS